jgi:hypothetical protein
MCKYCEALTSEKMDAYHHKYREFIHTEYSSNDFNEEDIERMANIVPPTPISMRRHKEDGFTSLIEVYLADDKRRVHHLYIPIKYCPMCGKEIE